MTDIRQELAFKKKSEIDEYIKNFRRRFKERFNIPCVVVFKYTKRFEVNPKFQNLKIGKFGKYATIYRGKDSKYVSLKRPSIADIEFLVNQSLLEFCKEGELKEGIKSTKRFRKLTYHRHIFSAICKRFGYNYTAIGNYLNKNHSTIIHSCRLISILLDVQDPVLLKYIENVNKKLVEAYGPDTVIDTSPSS